VDDPSIIIRLMDPREPEMAVNAALACPFWGLKTYTNCDALQARIYHNPPEGRTALLMQRRQPGTGRVGREEPVHAANLEAACVLRWE